MVKKKERTNAVNVYLEINSQCNNQVYTRKEEKKTVARVCNEKKEAKSEPACITIEKVSTR